MPAAGLAGSVPGNGHVHLRPKRKCFELKKSFRMMRGPTSWHEAKRRSAVRLTALMNRTQARVRNDPEVGVV